MRNLGCSVLSDELTDEAFFTALTRLNAPFGARCFLTVAWSLHSHDKMSGMS